MRQTDREREGRLNLGNFRYGKVERVKKIKDYAFVHFEERDQAVEGEEQSCKYFTGN